MWFLTADPVVCIPMILTEFPQGKNCGSFFKKHNFDEQVQFFDVHRLFFSCLAVGRHHRRRTPWCPHGLQLSRVKVLLTDHMHTRSWINHKLSFLRFYGGCGRHNPLIGGRMECSFVLVFELVNMSGKIPCLVAGASLLSFSLFWRPVLKKKKKSVWTSLMRNFHLYFSKRWSFIFSNTCLT